MPSGERQLTKRNTYAVQVITNGAYRIINIMGNW